MEGKVDKLIDGLKTFKPPTKVTSKSNLGSKKGNPKTKPSRRSLTE